LVLAVARVEVLLHFLEGKLAYLANVGSTWLSFVLC